MKGIIEQVSENESKSGPQYLTVQIDGERYSVCYGPESSHTCSIGGRIFFTRRPISGFAS